MENQELATRIKQADALYQEARLEAALEIYQDVLDQDESIAWAHSRIGAILAQLNDLDAAERSLLRAIELDPQLPQAHSNLGNVYYARGEFEAALTKYKDAVALDSTNPTFHENLHAAYKKLGRLSDAVGALKQAHRLDRDLGKAEAKAKMTAMKERISKRGCFGTVTTILVISTLLVAMFLVM